MATAAAVAWMTTLVVFAGVLLRIRKQVAVGGRYPAPDVEGQVVWMLMLTLAALVVCASSIGAIAIS